jgi:hypothetical protein
VGGQIVSDDFYHDDPIEEISKKSLRSKFLSTGVVIVGSIFFLQSTLAGNISLNSNRGIEFGQSVSQAVACSGDTELTLTPRSTFTNGSPGAHYLQSVTVSNIPTSCYGDDFTISAYNDSSSTPLALFNSTSTNAVVYNNNGTFELGVGTLTGASITSGSGTFTITFTNPVALSSSVFKSTIQSGVHAASASTGITWTSRNSAAENYWTNITYGNGSFVATSIDGTGNRVMTSPDGITWTSRTSAADNNWRRVTYGNGVFVAVSWTGTGNRVMTSPDGITWTSRATPDTDWYDVTYGNGMFVAVGASGVGNRVMTSSDGITWTSRNSAADENWLGVTVGNGIFVAVSNTGTGKRVMTSSNGTTWTLRTSAADYAWYDVTYGNGTFVAVAGSGTGNRVMTSPDGITWTSRTSAVDNPWFGVAYGNGTFVAVAASGTGNRVMTSTP